MLKTIGLVRSSVVNLRQGGFQRQKKALAAKLMLTSLIDAFSILVIYLLINFSTTGEILYVGKDMELPNAAKTIDLKRNTVVKIEKEAIYVGEKEVKLGNLVGHLADIQKDLKKIVVDGVEEEPSLTIQADRRIEFKRLSAIIQAAGHTGFSDIHFAVMQK